MKDYYVYKHTFPNGKVYIGITQQSPIKRWQHGLGYLTKNKNGGYHQPLMANAILKYGWDNVKHEILFECLTKEEAEAKEIELIAFNRSNESEFGYNIANGGNSFGRHTEESRKKMSDTRKGVPHTDEWNRKISKALMGNIPANKGRPISDEHKQRISEANTGRKSSEETIRKISKPVVCKEINVVYISATEAERQTGIRHENIARACKHNRTAGGYHWAYYTEDVAC